MCNQAAGLSGCLTRVQDAMSSQLKTLHLDKTRNGLVPKVCTWEVVKAKPYRFRDSAF